VAATLEGCAAAVTGGPSGACFAAGSAGKGSRVRAAAWCTEPAAAAA